MGNCIILNYHSIHDSTNPGNEDPIYSISTSEFKEQLEIIKSFGLKIITIPEIYTAKNENTISITFDDGFPSDYQHVFPILKEFDIKASFFITMKNIDVASPRWHEYNELKADGHYIGAHGITHRYLSDLNPTQQEFELKESQKIIQEKTGSQATIFSLPGGKYNDDTLNIAKSLGFVGLLTTDFGLCNVNQIPFLINRCTIHRNFNRSKLKKLLDFDNTWIQKEIRLSKRKKYIQKIIGNALSDKLNYLLRG